MGDERAEVLVIEDNPGDARLIQERLAAAEDITFDIGVATSLAEGMECVAAGDIDVVLLDLSLPDSQGLGTFLRAYGQFPHVPIVVITGLEDMSVAASALRNGAQDYLVKGQIDTNSLLRAIRFAMERHRCLQRVNPCLAGVRIPHSDAKQPGDLPIDSGILNTPLREHDPATFGALCQRYQELVEGARKQKLFRTVQNISAELHGLAMCLCMMGGGPRDMQEIHLAALEQLSADTTGGQLQMCVEEAQLLLLELLGYLADFYRDSALVEASWGVKRDTESSG